MDNEQSSSKPIYSQKQSIIEDIQSPNRQQSSTISRKSSTYKSSHNHKSQNQDQYSVNDAITIQLKDIVHNLDQQIIKTQKQKYRDLRNSRDSRLLLGHRKTQIRQALLNSFHGSNYQKNDIQQQMDQKLQKIRVQANKKANASKIDAMFVGIWTGFSLAVLILIIVLIVVGNISISDQSRFSRDFPTWRGIAIVIFYSWILGFDMYMFQKKKIMYRKFFAFNQNHFPHAVSIFKIAGLQTTIFLILFLFYILSTTNIYTLPLVSEEYLALGSWIAFAITLFLPIPSFSNKGRFFIFKLFFKALSSPFIGVTFAIAWLTDQFVSMAVPLKDFQYTICYYTYMDLTSLNYSECQDTHRVSDVVIVVSIVSALRILQCIRQGYDKGQYFFTPFFFNTIKYAVTMITALLAFQLKLQSSLFAVWVVFGCISTLYSFCWDIKMDWGLLEKNDKHPLLRKKLMYQPTGIYYVICVANLAMRSVWMLTFSPIIANFFGNVNLFYLATGMVQIFRRGIWNLLRFQKQHLHHEGQHKIDQDVKQQDKKRQLQEQNTKLSLKLLNFFEKFDGIFWNIKSQLQNQDLAEKQDLLKKNYNEFDEQQIKQIEVLLKHVKELNPNIKKQMERRKKRDLNARIKKQKSKNSVQTNCANSDMSKTSSFYTEKSSKK